MMKPRPRRFTMAEPAATPRRCGQVARCSQAGVSLVEVLVALLVVSLGLLAMVGLLGTASRFGKTSELRSTASLLAQDITDRMRANLEGAKAGNYDLVTSDLATALPDAAAACANAASCTAAELAAIDLAEWQASLFNSLPGGTGFVQFANGAADVWIIWQDPSSLSDDADKLAFLTGADGSTSACPPEFNLEAPVPSCMYFRVAR